MFYGNMHLFRLCGKNEEVSKYAQLFSKQAHGLVDRL